MDLYARLVSCDRGANLQHMRAQNELLLVIVCIVLHEGSISVGIHCLDDSCHACCFPVALSAEAVALVHKVLCSQTGELLHAVEILKGVGECLCALADKYLLDSYLLTSLISDSLFVFLLVVVELSVLLHESVYLCICNIVHYLNKVAYSKGIYLPAKLELCLYLVTLGNSYLAHIVAETNYLEALAEHNAYSGTLPLCYLSLYLGILPVTCNDSSRHTESCSDEAVLSVAVSGLVKVHVVHVYSFIRDSLIELCVEVEPRLLEKRKSVYPHL